MNISDPIGDMLTRIRNAISAKLDFVEAPHSNMKVAILRILKREGFVKDYVSEGRGAGKIMRIYLKYSASRGRDPVIRGLRRVSRPGLRRYVRTSDLRPLLSGTGINIISTSTGLLSDNDARKAHVGGEWICSIW